MASEKEKEKEKKKEKKGKGRVGEKRTEKMRGRQEVGNRVTADIDHVFSLPSPPTQRMINWTGNSEERGSRRRREEEEEEEEEQRIKKGARLNFHGIIGASTKEAGLSAQSGMLY